MVQFFQHVWKYIGQKNCCTGLWASRIRVNVLYLLSKSVQKVMPYFTRHHVPGSWSPQSVTAKRNNKRETQKDFGQRYTYLLWYKAQFMLPIWHTFSKRTKKNRINIESSHFKILEVQLLCTTDSPPLILVRFTSSFFCICSTIGAHAQEVWGKSVKD